VRLDTRLMQGVSSATSRREFLKRTAGWGAAAGLSLAGLEGAFATQQALADPACTRTENNLDHCTDDCTKSFCSGCNGSENADGCPAGYNVTADCGYDTAPIGCWCTTYSCVLRGGSYFRCRRTCCDCKNANGAKCTCRGTWSCTTKCGTAAWAADGFITIPA